MFYLFLFSNLICREPRGFGFVKFRYAEDAAEAKAHLNGTVIGGREIRIVFAEENRKTPQEMRKVLRTRCNIYVVCFNLQPCWLSISFPAQVLFTHII